MSFTKTNLGDHLASPISQPWTIKTCEASKENAKMFAEIHLAEIPSGFLSSLGLSFLTEFYYALIRSSGTTIHLATYDDSKLIIGFICSATEKSNCYQKIIISNWLPLLVTVTPRLFSVATIKKVWETLRFTNQSSSGPAATSNSARILNFCVDADFHGLGVAQELYSQHLEHLKNLGIKSVLITTGASQHRATKFYLKMGAVIIGNREVHAGVESIDLLHSLTINSSNSPLESPTCR